MSADEKELLEFTSRWDEAMIRNDAAEIGTFMSSDWTIVGSDGMTTRSDFLRQIAQGTLTHSRMDSQEVNIRLYGNTAIVIAKGVSEGTFSGGRFSLEEWSSSVFLKTDGDWKCILTMLTPVK